MAAIHHFLLKLTAVIVVSITLVIFVVIKSAPRLQSAHPRQKLSSGLFKYQGEWQIHETVANNVQLTVISFHGDKLHKQTMKLDYLSAF